MVGTVGVIGLGNMGGPMAGNLVKAGYKVRGFDLSPTCCEAALARGVAIAATAPAAAEEADAVVTMLPAGNHVLAVWKELADVIRPGALGSISSTIDVHSSRTAHALFDDKGTLNLDP